MTEQQELDYEMQPEYDFSGGRRNPYADRLRGNEQNWVSIDPELYARFPTSEAVNEALRSYLKLKDPQAA